MLVSFLNDLNLNNEKEVQALYSWIPKAPYVFLTNDSDVIKNLDPKNKIDQAFRSLFRDIPVNIPAKRITLYHREFQYPRVFLKNKRNDKLASLYEEENGYVVMLPQFKSNREAIVHICTHVYPKLFDVKQDLSTKLNFKKSKKLEDLEKQLKDEEKSLRGTTKKIEEFEEAIIVERNKSEKIIKDDSTAVKILGYFDDMLEDKTNSWFSGYKIVEAIYDQFNGESKAKEKLKLGKEFNFIKRISNESYRDTRHAPKKGEVKNPPTDEEIEKIVSYSKKIIEAYINYLII